METPPAGTCVVTVTYGDRLPLLRQVIEGALHAGAGAVLVVDNGSVAATAAGLAELKSTLGARLEILPLPENAGSAGGFKAGLQWFQTQSRFDCAWLLDDDNVPEPEALRVLRDHFTDLRQTHPAENFALLSLRDTRNKLARIAQGKAPSRVMPHRSSFQKWHVAQKLGRLAPSPESGHAPESRLPLPFASYGGLFLHRDLLTRIGLPDERLYLYVDDHEFTHRLTRLGGTLYLVPASRVRDIDASWGKATRKPRVLMSASDSRVYYAVRNRAWFEWNYWTDHRAMYFLNQALFCTHLAALAILRGRWKRFRLICAAVRDGHHARLGRRGDFPL